MTETDVKFTKRRRGRPKGSIGKRTLFAREWCDKLGLSDPVEFMVTVMNSDTVEVTKADAAGNAVLDESGKPVKQLAVVPLDTRLLCARELLGYMYPRLQAHQLQAQVDVDATVDGAIPTAAVLANPALCDALSELALLVASEPSGDEPMRQLPEPYPGMLDAITR